MPRRAFGEQDPTASRDLKGSLGVIIAIFLAQKTERNLCPAQGFGERIEPEILRLNARTQARSLGQFIPLRTVNNQLRIYMRNQIFKRRRARSFVSAHKDHIYAPQGLLFNWNRNWPVDTRIIRKGEKIHIAI